MSLTISQSLDLTVCGFTLKRRLQAECELLVNVNLKESDVNRETVRSTADLF